MNVIPVPLDSPVPVAGLVALISILLIQRIAELRISARHLERLLARGAVEFGHSHFPGFVLLHLALPVSLTFEVIAGGARPPTAWPWLLPPLALASLLRIAAIRSLGDRWHVRVWVVPGAPPVRSGIYRWIAHPNYLAVVIELALAPLLIGAWRTALAASLVNATLVSIRLRVEERSLRWAAAGAAPAPNAPRT